MQHLLDNAKVAFENAQKQTKVAKAANKKADVAKRILSDAQAGEHGAEGVQTDSEEVKNLINDANIANEKAKAALEKYDELHRVANKAVKDFNSKYHWSQVLYVEWFPTVFQLPVIDRPNAINNNWLARECRIWSTEFDLSFNISINNFIFRGYYVFVLFAILRR